MQTLKKEMQKFINDRGPNVWSADLINWADSISDQYVHRDDLINLTYLNINGIKYRLNRDYSCDDV